MTRGTVFCLFALLAVASAASISGSANLSGNSAGVSFETVFPKIPGFNYPLFGFSLLPTSSSSTNGTSSNNGTSSSNNGTSTNNGTSLNIPGLSTAIQLLEHKIGVALGIGQNLTAGFNTAFQQAFENNNSTAAANTIVGTILQTTLAVAEECPLVVVGERVLREGIRLSIEALKSANNIATG
ncbi:hypothetical protein HCN44_010447 [Aphidius gifuensis]|uniref:Odorant-binding protein n=1 Tax=Aphidius gifuensis TaxID=684658 RepID=A0A834XRT5_APHGI|nr:uncharacterized protein LOC122855534 [Aphidius gifuensis]KAF7991646.1 hypothetical protein HCN44_010447 [Aphidius gifuensis]